MNPRTLAWSVSVAFVLIGGTALWGALAAAPPAVDEEPAPPPPTRNEPSAEKAGEAGSRVRVVIEFWKPIRPQTVERLLKLKETNPEEYGELLEELKDRQEELQELKNEDPAEWDRRVAEQKLEGSLEGAAQKYRQGQTEEDRAAAEKEIRDLVKQQCDRRLRTLEEKLREREAEVAHLKIKIESMKKHPDLFVEDQKSRLLGYGGIFEDLDE